MKISFQKTICNEAEKIVSDLNIKKSCQQEDIPTETIKLDKDLIATFMAENFNSYIDEFEFASELKHANVVSIHKKKIRVTKVITDQEVYYLNYSKVYEKLIYNQLYQYFENILFPSQCGFPKGYITFYAPICNSCPNL